MLTIQPARRRSARGRKLAVALAGGGPLGAFYEIGALHALGEAIDGRALTDFDCYVGVSSGSLIAAGLANGFDTATMGATFIHDEATLLPFSPETLLQPALGEYARRIALLPQSLLEAGRQFAREPWRGVWSALVSSVGRVIPTAVFDNRPLERYLHEAFSAAGRTNEFRRLRAQLYVVATNLNTGESVAFGKGAHVRVPISRALVASAALPGLYPPVEIGGQQYVDGALVRTLHASLALEAGCDLVICVNPLVPFDAARARSPKHANLADAGLPAILGQTFRALIHSRMQIGMASYAARYPQADMLLLQPDRTDERLFFANVFRYTGRSRLVEHAYQRTRQDLLAHADELGALLERRGLHLDMRCLRDRRRTFVTAGRESTARSRHAARRLDLALRQLETLLSHGRAAG
jgi:NTE family protein